MREANLDRFGSSAIEKGNGMNDKLDITPSVTVHALLEAYPELEEVLIGIAAPFKKLRNPILRRSVAKVATLKHAATVGNVPLNDLVSALRQAVGQPLDDADYEDENYFQPQPEWFSARRIMLKVNESKPENENEMTLGPIMRGAKKLVAGDIIELTSDFVPAPGIDVMRRKGYKVWVSRESGSVIKTYFLKT